MAGDNNARAFSPLYRKSDGSFVHVDFQTLPSSFDPSTLGPVIAMIYSQTTTGNQSPVLNVVNTGDARGANEYPGVVNFNLVYNGTAWDRVNSLNTTADALAASQIGMAAVVARICGLNASGTYDRIRVQADSADAVVTIATGAVKTATSNYAFNGTTWDRVRSQANNADAVAVATLGNQAVAGYSYAFNGTTWDRSRSQANNGDAVATVAAGAQLSASDQYGFNGATWDRVRAANTFKSVEVSASGDTTIWTPTSGKKFRLMGGTISASGTAAALTATLLKLQDGASGTNIVQFRIAIATTVTGDTQISFTLDNGRLSGAINTVLNANLSTALTAGSMVVNVYGTEE